MPIWILTGTSFCQDFDIELTLLNTGQFTLNNWQTVEQLWYLDIENTGSLKIDYYLQFKLIRGADLLAEGHTKSLFIEPKFNIFTILY